MAAILCPDFFEEVPGIIPGRIKRTNPESIEDRFANLTYSMDLSPLPGDEEVGNQFGAWSLGDLPVAHAAQIDDDNGDDLICVAVLNRVYRLNRSVYRDEWEWNTFAPIYRQVTIGPIPYAEEDVGKGDFNLAELKRFLEFQFQNKDAPQAGPLSKWRFSVGEWENEDETYVTVARQGGQRMRARIAVKGRSFTVRLEHAANEPIHIEHWEALWQSLGRRLSQSKRTS